MRLAILSDVHANLEALDATLRDVSAAPPRSNRAPVRPAPRAAPETVIVREAVVGAPKTVPKPDTTKVEVFRGATKTEQKFAKDSAVRRDTIPNN